MSKLFLPYEGRILLSSGYGPRTLNGSYDWHPGLDLVGQEEKTVRAAGDGVVVYSAMVTDRSDRTWEWGNFVCVRTEGYYVYTCHLARRLVKAGQTVKAGDPLGIEGNTGYSFGDHCHFEIRGGDGKAVDPFPVLGLPGSKNVPGTVFVNTFGGTPDDEREDGMKMTGEEIYRALTDYLKTLPESEWSKKEGGMTAAMETIGTDGRPLMDGSCPRCYVTREQIAAILLRAGITG